MPVSVRNNRGFTLVELMSAMVITLVALMGLLVAMNYASQTNFRTQQRDEAVQVAEVRMARFRTTPFSAAFSMLSTTPGGRYQYAPETWKSKLRGGGASYKIIRSTVSSGTDNAVVDLGVRVSWKFKNMSTSHEVHSTRYRDE